jgi:hypothetical protein
MFFSWFGSVLQPPWPDLDAEEAASLWSRDGMRGKPPARATITEALLVPRQSWGSRPEAIEEAAVDVKRRLSERPLIVIMKPDPEPRDHAVFKNAKRSIGEGDS